ncbi:MAG: hypothetical protein ACI81R_000998 [Bradymonadia bacterium]|jgi:hypothetical protein
MDAKLLIDAIVQQTTVLIAHLSTASGVRAPLAHVADQVFVEISREIEAQGVSRKVAADMFGMALRTYQRKVQRLTESATETHKTLWSAVLEYVREHESVTRREVLTRFRYDESEQVGAVLNDLVSSGLLSKTGRSASTLFRSTADADLKKINEGERLEVLPWFVWTAIYRAEQCTTAELIAQLPFSASEVTSALETLLADGRAEHRDGSEGSVLVASSLVVPVGATAGWEAAVFDHYQALCQAIMAKVGGGASRSDAKDVVGGATLSFDIYDDHPHRDAVLGLLERVRTDVNTLWRDVSAYNAEHPVTAEERPDKRKVVFYFGQSVGPADNDPLDSNTPIAHAPAP